MDKCGCDGIGNIVYKISDDLYVFICLLFCIIYYNLDI